MKFELSAMPTLKCKVETMVNSLKHNGIKVSTLEIGNCSINLGASMVVIEDKDCINFIEAGILAFIDENGKESKHPERPCKEATK